MADAVSDTPKLSLSPDHNANPSKFLTHFLYKAALVTVFLVLLPLFPSLAPDCINQTLHARSWELLQLICVGIAVSYGLFSKKNDEMDKDHSPKVDNAQSYVSKLLQASSVFDDDESENHTLIEENKFQALNSQYYRGEPVVVVAKESPVVEDENGVVSQISQRPLLLPVRSLKQRVPNSTDVDLADHESGEKNLSRSGSRRFTSSNSRKSRNGDLGGLNVQKMDEKLEENVVLRSPIPWRSRSGRMEVKENGDDPPPSMEEPESNRLEKTRSSKSSGPASSPKNLSSKKLSPSTSFSSESQAKTSEDVVRKKVFSPPQPAPPPPPPPPLPTPQFLRKSMLTKSNSSVANNADSPEKVFRRSARSVPETETDATPRRTNPGFGSDTTGRIQNDGSVKSVRTFRPSELGVRAEKESDDYETKNEILEKVLMETTDDEESDAETEDDHFEVEGPGHGEAATDHSNGNDVGPDVDKKADEFIAKFREQIRLQRIESIRRTTAQRAGKNLR